MFIDIQDVLVMWSRSAKIVQSLNLLFDCQQISASNQSLFVEDLKYWN